ncbi:MAG: helix-turn-helix domain-containing protein [Flavobacteriales bacterium]
MASLRCKMLVLAELEKIGLSYTIAELEEADIEGIGPDVKYTILSNALRNYEIVLKGEKRCVLLDQMKLIILEMIYRSDDLPRIKLSVHLSEKLHHNYTYLANLFAHVHGYTVEHFIIEHKISRAKELLLLNEFTLTEIAWKLRYSSVAHLSSQFKKTTGSTPSHFKRNVIPQVQAVALLS